MRKYNLLALQSHNLLLLAAKNLSCTEMISVFLKITHLQKINFFYVNTNRVRLFSIITSLTYVLQQIDYSFD